MANNSLVPSIDNIDIVNDITDVPCDVALYSSDGREFKIRGWQSNIDHNRAVSIVVTLIPQTESGGRGHKS